MGVNPAATAQAVVRNHQGGELTRDQKTFEQVCNTATALVVSAARNRVEFFKALRGILAAPHSNS